MPGPATTRTPTRPVIGREHLAEPVRAGAVPAVSAAWPVADGPAEDGGSPEQRAARAFGEVLGRAGDDAGLDAVLRPAAEALCALLGVGRCSVYLRDGRDHRFQGRLAHPPALDPLVRRLAMGGASDALTAEVLERRAAVAVLDARRDPRTARSVVRDQRVCSVLVVPMVHHHRVLGLAYLDDEGRRRVFSPDDVAVATALGAHVARWIDRSLQVARLAVAQRELDRERTYLRRAAIVEQRLAEVAGTPFDVVLDAVAALAGRPVEVLGGRGEPLASADPDAGASRGGLGPGGGRAVLEQLAETPVGRARRIDPDLGHGLTRRLVGTPLLVGGGRGCLALIECGTPLSSFDLVLAPRAAAALARAGGPESVVDLERDDARALLIARMLGPEAGLGDPGAVAERLGLEPRRPRAVALVEPAPADGGVALAAALAPAEHTAVPTAAGLAVVVDLPADVPSRPATARLRDLVVEALGTAAASTAVGVSGACASLDGLPRALRQARALVDAGPGRGAAGRGPVAATIDELGPARMLMTDPADAGSMGEDVLGPLLEPDPAVHDLLVTLVTFFAQGGSVRSTAVCLAVHENTVRHRFGRIRALTDLDVVGDGDDRLLAHAAATALRLAGRAPEPAAGSADADAEVPERP